MGFDTCGTRNLYFRTFVVVIAWSLLLLGYFYIYFPKNVKPSNNVSSFVFSGTTRVFTNRTQLDFKILKTPFKVSLHESEISDLTLALAQAKKKMYKIVLWGPKNYSTPFYPIDFDECGACKVTYNKSEMNDSDTKALVVYFNRIHKPIPIPTTRREDQLFVWWSLEAPPALAESRLLPLQDIHGIFNLTMSYRRDSDIYDPNGMAPRVLHDVTKSNQDDPMKEVDELILKKTGFAICVISDCTYTSGAAPRLEYVHQLMGAGLKLETRGRCFPGTKPVPDINIAMTFKFYLAFENSKYCRDYITEKFWVNSLLWGAVPVVLGARKADYKAVFPAGSFVFAEDYDTPKKLVDYLNYLDKNVTAYKEYFKWRTMKAEDMPNYKRTVGFCHLCRVLHGINVDNAFNPRRKELESFIPMFGFPNKSRTVNVREWFYGNESRDCLPRY